MGQAQQGPQTAARTQRQAGVCRVTFHRVDRLHFPLTCRWAFGWFPCFDGRIMLWKFMCKFLCGCRLSFLWGIRTPRRGIAGPYGNTVSNFLMNFHLFSKWLHHFTFPRAMYTGSSFSRLSSTFTIWILYYNLHNGAKCYLLVVLMCMFLMPNDVQVSMSVSFCFLVIYVSFVRNVY